MREREGKGKGGEGMGGERRGGKEGRGGKKHGPLLFAAMAESSSGHEVWYL